MSAQPRNSLINDLTEEDPSAIEEHLTVDNDDNGDNEDNGDETSATQQYARYIPLDPNDPASKGYCSICGPEKDIVEVVRKFSNISPAKGELKKKRDRIFKTKQSFNQHRRQMHGIKAQKDTKLICPAGKMVRFVSHALMTLQL